MTQIMITIFVVLAIVLVIWLGALTIYYKGYSNGFKGCIDKINETDSDEMIRVFNEVIKENSNNDVH